MARRNLKDPRLRWDSFRYDFCRTLVTAVLKETASRKGSHPIYHADRKNLTCCRKGLYLSSSEEVEVTPVPLKGDFLTFILYTMLTFLRTRQS